jgi:hypothetical protein
MGNFWIVPLLYSVSDIMLYDITATFSAFGLPVDQFFPPES